MKKKILYGVLAVFILIQFIRPARNVTEFRSMNDITLFYLISDQLRTTLVKSCYDCHSNHTVYPWYANIQPVGWWMQGHINEAKENLNFSEFGTYSLKKAKHKFEEIEEMVRDHEMPISSYLLLHPDAKLSALETERITRWAGGLKQ